MTNKKNKQEVKAKVEYIHDFGELGRWSESTLKAQRMSKPIYDTDSTISHYEPTVSLIEDKYHSLTKKLEKDSEVIEKRKVRALRIRELWHNLRILEDINRRIVKLAKNYGVYRTAMTILCKEQDNDKVE